MGVNPSEKAAMFFNPRCKQWSCPVCGDLNKDYWVYQATRGSMLLLENGNWLQFVTLTGRGYFTPNSSIHFFRQNWPKFRKRLGSITQKYQPLTGTEWAYFLIPERHQSGVLHCHFIASTPLMLNKWYKDNAMASGFGFMAKVKPIYDSARAAGYVTKYLTKDAGDTPWPKGFMRVRHSANWPIKDTLDIPGWSWQTINENEAWIEKNAYIDLGWQVIDKRQIDL